MLSYPIDKKLIVTDINKVGAGLSAVAEFAKILTEIDYPRGFSEMCSIGYDPKNEIPVLVSPTGDIATISPFDNKTVEEYYTLPSGHHGFLEDMLQLYGSPRLTENDIDALHHILKLKRIDINTVRQEALDELADVLSISYDDIPFRHRPAIEINRTGNPIATTEAILNKDIIDTLTTDYPEKYDKLQQLCQQYLDGTPYKRILLFDSAHPQTYSARTYHPVLDIQSMLTVSVNHVPRRVYDELIINSDPYHVEPLSEHLDIAVDLKGTTGVIIYLLNPDKYGKNKVETFMESNLFSNPAYITLYELLCLAVKNNCTVLCLDADADTVDDIKTFDWI